MGYREGGIHKFENTSLMITTLDNYMFDNNEFRREKTKTKFLLINNQ